MATNTTRRGFLTLAGVTLMSAACSQPVARKGTGKAEAVDKLAQLLPKHIPYKGVTPDVNTPIAIGFNTYPKDLVKAIPQTPGAGGSYTAIIPLWGPPPPSPNPYYDLVNKSLGATVKLQIIDGNSFGDKIAPILAAGNVGDLTAIPSFIIQKLGDFDRQADKLFLDLGPYLSGDKSAQYPMLAAISEEAWAFGVWNGKLMSVPHPGQGPARMTYYRKDIFDTLGAKLWNNADELFELGKQLTDKSKKRWAFATIHQEIERAFRVPSKWRLANGKLEHKYETKEYADAVAFMRKLFEAELVHPKVVAAGAANDPSKELFEGGQALIYDDGTGAWHEAIARQGPVNPNFNMQPHNWTADGGQPYGWYSDPAWMFVFLKKDLPKEKVEELLRILNWLAAPIGTQEYHTWKYGVEGTDWKDRDANGFPVYTKKGQQEAQPPTYFFLANQVEPMAPYTPDYIKTYGDYLDVWYKSVEDYPFKGLRTQDPSRMAAAQQPMEDKVLDIVKGRRPLSDLSTVVQQWRDAGGEEARTFYTKVLKDNGRI
ncbi:sugar ABC transporter substrate-binding protein [Nonomuraea sp. NPDC049695]|uniref:sugar ABC transporter substrate-binding protein n=1 Tax=Nonomuraea sp. NPDC049695 TaxID=3154734 RepID=UPI003427A802